MIVRAEPVVWQRIASDLPWEHLYLAEPVARTRIAAAIAAVFDVPVARVGVFGPADVLRRMAATGMAVDVWCYPKRGDLPLSMDIQRNGDGPAPDGLALATHLARTLGTACVTGIRLVWGTRSGWCDLRVWPDGRRERVVLAENHGVERDPPLLIAEVLALPEMG